MIARCLALAAMSLCLTSQATAQHDPGAHPRHHAADSSFDAMQRRGKVAMGVDQYTSVHRFDDLVDGGRIELQGATDDTVGVRTIREHLRGIARAFAAGDFTTPAFVHMQAVPGAATMAARRSTIRYAFSQLPRGGVVRITTVDRAALDAVHRFLAFQRTDHRAGGTSSIRGMPTPRTTRRR